MTAGQFIKLDVLHNNFGAERVFQNARRLREISLYNRGWKEVDYQIISIFLFSLFATSSPVQAIRAVQRAQSIYSGEKITTSNDRTIISFITQLLIDDDLREKIDFILVSQKTGNTEVFFKPGKKKGHQTILFAADSPLYNLDYDNELVPLEETDSMTRVDMVFFDTLLKEISES